MSVPSRAVKHVIERRRLAVVRDFLLDQAVEPRRLEKHHGIGIADRGEQQAVGAARRGGIDDPDARNVREHRLGALGMVLRRVDAGAARRAQHHRAGQPPARAMAHAPGVVEDLVDRGVGEAGELDLRDRLQPLDRHADAHAGDEALGERRVDHALGAEAPGEPQRRAEHAAVHAHVLAEHDDGGIVLHLALEREVDRFDEGDLRHAQDW